MLRVAILFFVIGLVSIVFGSYGIAGISMEIGRTLLYIFVALAVISLIAGIFSGRGGTPRIT
jgi:uncharacterized membrane protein YtjA (UPF0391 family)